MARPKHKNTTKQKKAFILYSMEDRPSLTKICEEVGTSRNTFNSWRKKFNWDARLKKIEKKAEQKLDENISKTKSRQLKICRAVQLKFGQRFDRKAIKEGRAKAFIPNFQDADKAMKHELLIKGEVTDRVDVAFDKGLEMAMAVLKKK